VGRARRGGAEASRRTAPAGLVHRHAFRRGRRLSR
jgi:hypothetical protein